MGAGPDETEPRWRRVLALVPLIVLAGLALLFLARLRAGDPARLPSPLIGKPVPDFALPPLEGLAKGGKPLPGLDAAALRAGAVTVVNVWASWCLPCRQEHPALSELAKDPRLTLVGIDYKDSPENARRFLGALGNPFAAVGADVTGRVGVDWGVYGVPETFVVGGDGIIRYKHVGPLSEEALRAAIEAAAAARPGG